MQKDLLPAYPATAVCKVRQKKVFPGSGAPKGDHLNATQSIILCTQCLCTLERMIALSLYSLQGPTLNWMFASNRRASFCFLNSEASTYPANGEGGGGG